MVNDRSIEYWYIMNGEKPWSHTKESKKNVQKEIARTIATATAATAKAIKWQWHYHQSCISQNVRDGALDMRTITIAFNRLHNRIQSSYI